MMLLGFMKGHTPNRDELYAVNASVKLMDDFIISSSYWLFNNRYTYLLAYQPGVFQI
ncbi:hypothetical protein ASZ90_017185 [hydrocarbon metagenome]|uniref:Uncharacterized protein n=1 Tax=hydrocarbon metagenome TaxID=938273 RepID=A0A0W8E9Q2_9ZZZZ